ncbi:MAG: hypothetical protein A2020_14290 [Lentisphaerae bacterium GWF2_45_14]|nr:MAG: hypothetical protein A2020_14290 [Lentisphaerae bacterium GWF2_45_14]
MGKIEEENLKKLAATNLATNFVKKNNGEWNHQKWLDFCAFLEQKSYCPINLDQVGLLLEKKKAEFFEGCKCGCGCEVDAKAVVKTAKVVKPVKAVAPVKIPAKAPAKKKSSK